MGDWVTQPSRSGVGGKPGTIFEEPTSKALVTNSFLLLLVRHLLLLAMHLFLVNSEAVDIRDVPESVAEFQLSAPAQLPLGMEVGSAEDEDLGCMWMH